MRVKGTSRVTFDTVLAKIRRESKNPRDLGKKFEKITRDFLLANSVHAERFDKVYLWKEWPENDGPDTGIDLVARQYRDGELCAIQCKCYADDGSLDMKSVSTFLAKAQSLKMKHTILVYTGETLTKHAEKLLKDSRTSIITPEHFRQSSIDWSNFPKIRRIKNPHKLRSHQVTALKDILNGFERHDRGKLIMACGTGKTLTALHVAEKEVGLGGIVLYLVPSISLILQSMREWSENANIRHNYMAVCSDKSTGEDGSITELESPVSTDVDTLKPYLKNLPSNAMNVVFSTYHSIEVVEKAMKGTFDLAFCDEAHRTAGAEGRSYYTRIHDDKNLRVKKRLYMTATPRVYSDAIKSMGSQKDKIIYSMDDEDKYGPEFHKLSFSDAVHKHEILADFKVKIAIVDADKVNKEFQQSVADDDRSMPLDERTLLAAVWHGMCYPEDDESQPKLLQRVIAFANKIDRSEMFAGIRKDPDDNDLSFEGIVNEINQKNPTGYKVDVRHIDGKDRALYRRNEMRWLDASNKDPNTCRIISNARCLSEGVDVPALDGVVFLNPRKSVIDVVQSVGRVMRKVPEKEFGYVILPVAIPAGLKYEEAMNDNKTFKVVWEVLNALRSHDGEFAREINNLILDRKSENTGSVTPRISISILDDKYTEEKPIANLFDKIKSKIIEKVGDINYYDKYGQTIGATSRTIETRIRNKIRSSKEANTQIKKLQDNLKKIINDSITKNVTIQVVAQHMVLSRVFDALFQGEFTSHNPISSELDKVAKKMGLREELLDLEDFYKDVDAELQDITTREARQNFIKKIYGNFFESVDKKETEQHGIVYTPVEIIDFIIHSVEYILQKHFAVGFNDRVVKVLEPFAGTGTFITRLLESGLITDNLYEKYKNDLYANELILLAYYVATVNIETTYQSLRKGGKYVPFDGMSYTDTLQINPRWREGEEHRHQESKFGEEFKAAHERLRAQRGSHLHVLMGNPPYSAGQSNYNDQNPNTFYPDLDQRIKGTYVVKTKVHNKNSLYDSYIRSLRWASDRIGKSGIIAFVTNASFIRSDAAAGIRACIKEEFNEIWCFDLRGNQRTQGEVSRKEGGKIFGSGSRAPVSITILVKNSQKKGCTIHYKDIGDYLTREQKLETVKIAKSINGIQKWQAIKPDKHYDWLNQRPVEFYQYAPIGSKDTKSGININAVFQTYSSGIKTNRDTWMYNSSFSELSKNMKVHIGYCNKYRFKRPRSIDPKQAKWSGELSERLKQHGKTIKFSKANMRNSIYRPFFKQYLYFDKIFINSVYQIPKFFPEGYSKNLVICVPYKFTGEFSALVTDITPDLELVHHGQCFPLYVYERNQDKKSNITEYALREYQTHYKDKNITKKSIFYYVYALLHHPQYKTKFANNLIRELPHIPMAPDFWGFSDIGKKLVDLHLNFETCPRYKLGKPKVAASQFSRLSFAKKRIKIDGSIKNVSDKTKLRLDGTVIFDNIPKIKYSVNGRTPLEWIIDRYKINYDAESDIENDPCTGTDIIPVIERAIYVGIESDRLISELPKKFEPKNWKPAKTGLDKYTNNAG